MKLTCYSRPDKPWRKAVQKRGAPETARSTLPLAEPLAVHGGSECHVTPPDVAARMVGYLGPVVDGAVLEPEAGTGNLVEALFEAGYSRHQVTAVELVDGLADAVVKRFSGEVPISPYRQCFLEFAAKTAVNVRFSRVVMNPPFRQVKKHMAAALKLLDAGDGEAVLVALVPITYEHADAETLETLPSDTFALAKVNTKIIRITR